MKILPLLLPLLFFISCKPTPKNEATVEIPANDAPGIAADTAVAAREKTDSISVPTNLPYRFPYDLSAPDQTLQLSKKLTEISGLSLSPDGRQLIAVNDEQGKIFYLNKTNGKIEREVKFASHGDYEGIEAVADDIYVVKSNGDVYQVNHPEKDKPKTKNYNTPLNSNHDVEGLGYDKTNNRLLLACKGKAGDGKDMKEKRAVYAFDLKENKLLENPIYLIDRGEIGKYFQSEDVTQKIVGTLSPNHASNAFAPSGIAIHPKTGDICIVSSVGKLLIVLSSIGPIKYIQKLDSSLFKQPEGICFDANGDLFISSEGRGGRAKLFRFSQN